jgi:hypothetical protein
MFACSLFFIKSFRTKFMLDCCLGKTEYIAMNLTELEDKAAKSRYGKMEMKLWCILLVLLLIVVVTILGRIF